MWSDCMYVCLSGIKINGRTAAVLWGVASRICSRPHVLFLCSSYLFFMPFVSIHVVIWTQLQFERNLILSERSDFYMINNLLIAIHTFSIHMLTLFSVDEMWTGSLILEACHLEWRQLLSLWRSQWTVV